MATDLKQTSQRTKEREWEKAEADHPTSLSACDPPGPAPSGSTTTPSVTPLPVSEASASAESEPPLAHVPSAAAPGGPPLHHTPAIPSPAELPNETAPPTEPTATSPEEGPSAVPPPHVPASPVVTPLTPTAPPQPPLAAATTSAPEPPLAPAPSNTTSQLCVAVDPLPSVPSGATSGLAAAGVPHTIAQLMDLASPFADAAAALGPESPGAASSPAPFSTRETESKRGLASTSLAPATCTSKRQRLPEPPLPSGGDSSGRGGADRDGTPGGGAGASVPRTDSQGPGSLGMALGRLDHDVILRIEFIKSEEVKLLSFTMVSVLLVGIAVTSYMKVRASISGTSWYLVNSDEPRFQDNFITGLCCVGITGALWLVYVARGLWFCILRMRWDARRHRLYLGRLAELTAAGLSFCAWTYASNSRRLMQDCHQFSATLLWTYAIRLTAANTLLCLWTMSTRGITVSRGGPVKTKDRVRKRVQAAAVRLLCCWCPSLQGGTTATAAATSRGRTAARGGKGTTTPGRGGGSGGGRSGSQQLPGPAEPTELAAVAVGAAAATMADVARGTADDDGSGLAAVEAAAAEAAAARRGDGDDGGIAAAAKSSGHLAAGASPGALNGSKLLPLATAAELDACTAAVQDYLEEVGGYEAPPPPPPAVDKCPTPSGLSLPELPYAANLPDPLPLPAASVTAAVGSFKSGKAPYAAIINRPPAVCTSSVTGTAAVVAAAAAAALARSHGRTENASAAAAERAAAHAVAQVVGDTGEDEVLYIDGPWYQYAAPIIYLWTPFQCLVGVNIALMARQVPHMAGEGGCLAWYLNCNISGKASTVFVSVLLGAQAIYLFIYFFYCFRAFSFLRSRSYVLYRSLNISLSVEVRIRGITLIFLLVNEFVQALYVPVVSAAGQESQRCSYSLDIILGVWSTQVVTMVLVCIVAWIFLPRSIKGDLPIMQATLQRFAWTETDVPHQLARRLATMPPQFNRFDELLHEPLFCFETAIKLTYWCEHAYYYEEPGCTMRLPIETLMGLYRLEHIDIIRNEDSDAKVMIAWNSERCLLCFRGTASLKAACVDLKAVLVPYYQRHAWSNYRMATFAAVHHGFQWSWLHGDFNRQVIDWVRQYRSRHEHGKILVTGHSLGGAHAALCTLDLILTLGASLPYNHISCYTFGSPRVGNHSFATLYNKAVRETWHVINGNDVIPLTPKFVAWFVYKQPGHKVIVKRRGDLVVRPTFTENAVVRMPCSRSVTQHLLGSYIRSLMAVLRNQTRGKHIEGGVRALLHLTRLPLPEVRAVLADLVSEVQTVAIAAVEAVGGISTAPGGPLGSQRDPSASQVGAAARAAAKAAGGHRGATVYHFLAKHGSIRLLLDQPHPQGDATTAAATATPGLSASAAGTSEASAEPQREEFFKQLVTKVVRRVNLGMALFGVETGMDDGDDGPGDGGPGGGGGGSGIFGGMGGDEDGGGGGAGRGRLHQSMVDLSRADGSSWLEMAAFQRAAAGRSAAMHRYRRQKQEQAQAQRRLRQAERRRGDQHGQRGEPGGGEEQVGAQDSMRHASWSGAIPDRHWLGTLGGRVVRWSSLNGARAASAVVSPAAAVLKRHAAQSPGSASAGANTGAAGGSPTSSHTLQVLAEAPSGAVPGGGRNNSGRRRVTAVRHGNRSDSNGRLPGSSSGPVSGSHGSKSGVGGSGRRGEIGAHVAAHPSQRAAAQLAPVGIGAEPTPVTTASPSPRAGPASPVGGGGGDGSGGARPVVGRRGPPGGLPPATPGRPPVAPTSADVAAGMPQGRRGPVAESWEGPQGGWTSGGVSGASGLPQQPLPCNQPGSNGPPPTADGWFEAQAAAAFATVAVTSGGLNAVRRAVVGKRMAAVRDQVLYGMSAGHAVRRRRRAKDEEAGAAPGFAWWPGEKSEPTEWGP